MARWVNKSRSIYQHSSCLLCGASYGICSGEPKVCKPTTCLACGSTQCMANGLARGQCSICYIGLLAGWSGNDRPCMYAGCQERAIAHADGVNSRRCRVHLERGKWKGYIDRAIRDRDKSFTSVDDSGPFPKL